MRGVHAAHDLHIYRLLEAGESVATKATIVSVKAATPGALLVTRIDTTDRSDKLICRSFHSTILRDVRIVNSFDCTAGEPTIPTVPRAAHEARDQARFTLVVPEGLAHIYSECARIWNPIHTDRAFALAAGLTDIILHGTATLALSVSRLVNEFMAGDPTPIRRISCRFSGMVPVPSVLTLKVHSHLRQTIRFSLVTNHGSVALRDGYLSYRVRG